VNNVESMYVINLIILYTSMYVAKPTTGHNVAKTIKENEKMEDTFSILGKTPRH
jgi:hypothetical protein